MNKIIFLLFPENGLFANDFLDNKFIQLMEKDKIVANKKLLDILFENNNSKDIMQTVKILKQNGLLKIFYQTPQKLKVRFIFNNKAIMGIKTINEILNKLGYQYFITNQLEKDKDTIKYTIEYSSQHIIDPVALSDGLKKYDIKINNIIKDKKNWIYYLDMDNPTIYHSVDINDTLVHNFKNPNGEFWVTTKANQSIVELSSKSNNIWHPYVVFFDKDLKILKIFKRKNIRKKVVLKVPDNNRYIKITDLYSSQNLNNGILIALKEFE